MPFLLLVLEQAFSIIFFEETESPIQQPQQVSLRQQVSKAYRSSVLVSAVD